MKVTIKGKTTNFDVEAVNKMNIDEFTKFCLGLSTFKQLAPKERNLKIKEVYGNINSNVKQISKPKSRPDLHANNVKSNTRDIKAESGTDDGGKNIDREKDRAEVQKQKVHSEKKKT